MVDQKSNRWNWEVSGFEPRKPLGVEDHHPARLLQRCSMPPPSLSAHTGAWKTAIASKIEKLEDTVKIAKIDCLELRQEAIDLQEYSNAKLDRVTRYLGALADKTHMLDQVVIEAESRISPLKNETRRLFNELLTIKGKIKVFCRVRPLFEDEGTSVVEFPDDCTVRIITGDDIGSNVKKDFEFDRVYGPHVGQVELFNDIQPFVQSALDGYNVSVFAYGQTGAGKTHTMEGSSHERGLYARCFEELFDLSNLDSTSTSRFDFFLTVFELYNEQIRDLLSESTIDSSDSLTELTQKKVDNPLTFSGVLKSSFHNRGTDVLKFNVSHLVITIHVYYQNMITGEKLNSKLSLVDLAASDCLITEDETGERITDFLHVMKSLSALGDVLSSLTSNKDVVPYENSVLTRVLSDSLGGSSKTMMIVNICPNFANISDTISSLNFSARARNTVLSLGNRDTIKKWRDIANESRKELYEKENEVHNLMQDILRLGQELKGANDQGVLLFNEVQKAWKVSYTMQSDLKSENIMLAEKYNVEKDQNTQLRNQVAKLLQLEQDQIIQIQQQASALQNLEAKIANTELQLSNTRRSSDGLTVGEVDSRASSIVKATAENMDSFAVSRKLEGELLKRDALIERLHEENEKLFDRLTEKEAVAGSPQLCGPSSKGFSRPQNLGSLPVTTENENMVALVKSNPETVKTTPAGEYLTTALYEFDPEQFDSLAAISDGANKLLMLVLAAVIKAGVSREHEILAEIRDAVFLFIRKMEPRRLLDTMLVSRVRILYIRSFLARSPELQSIKVSSIERFLEKSNAGHSRTSSRGNSPGRSPAHYDSRIRNSLPDEQIQGFKVNLKQEKKSKLSSVVLKIRGIDQENWRQHVTGGKLREITEDAKSFATGNKSLAALFVHTPAGELQRQIRSWLAENFEYLSITGDDSAVGTTNQLELLSTAIMDGWMAGLGAAVFPNTDALGQLLSVYSRRVYASQLQHLKDIAGTLAAEEAVDSSSVAKLRSALTSVDHKRRRILQQMKSDIALQTLDDGGPPITNPCTAAEDARLASLISLDEIVKQIKDILQQASVGSVSINKKRAMLGDLDELEERMPSLLEIDHPFAERQIADARSVVESIQEEQETDLLELGSQREVNVAQWNVLQFNTGTTSPFIIKCGANSKSELVIKADARIQEPKGGEIVRVVPRPSCLENTSLDEFKNLFSQLPEGMSLLALARTADGTRARYSRLYRTLAMKVLSLRDLVGELERDGALKDAR